jgi:hypothetical protein
MLFRPVVQRHAKRNAQDATLAGWSVVPPRHAMRRARSLLQSGAWRFSAADRFLLEKYLSWLKEKYFS